MYTVVTSKQMAQIEGHAYDEGSREEDFMENAGYGVSRHVEAFCHSNDLPQKVALLCGKGNNGGDAYVAGRHLMDQGFQVTAYQVDTIENASPLSKQNHLRFKQCGGRVVEVDSAENLDFGDAAIIVDALFGTGLKSAPREPYASIIDKANRSQLPIIAVDIPSGLNGDTGDAEGSVIKAAETIFLGLPKRGFFLKDGWNHVGELHDVNFGLPQKNIDEAPLELTAFTEDDFVAIMPPIQANRHKYQAGYVVGVAGSPGMPGAANLSASAALRGGAGIVRLLHQQGMEAELSSSMYELIKTPYDPHHPEQVIDQLKRAGAVFIGPGMGLTDATRHVLRLFLPEIEKPTVIDADGLNILAEEEIALPKEVVMTPHVGEMRRLLESDERGPVDWDFLQQCQEYAEKRDITLVLKGGPSFILHPGKPKVVVPFGDPGMATAGSGDVLTGLIAALLSQGLSTRNAAMAGVFIHAYAGEVAAMEQTSYCMTATDIIHAFPEAFSLLE